MKKVVSLKHQRQKNNRWFLSQLCDVRREDFDGAILILPARRQIINNNPDALAAIGALEMVKHALIEDEEEG